MQWLDITVPSSYWLILMGHYNHSFSFDVKIMVTVSSSYWLVLMGHYRLILMDHYFFFFTLSTYNVAFSKF